nr:hypothetical protein [Tanacetum cinerariifolium]
MTLIKFPVVNGKKPLILDNKTFVESTGLDYAKDRTPVPKTRFHVAWRILFIFVVQGPEALGSLPQKRKKPKSKKTPTETQVTPPIGLTEGSEQSHLVSSGNMPDPQDIKRTKQLAGTVKTTLLPEGPRVEKDSKGLKPLADMESLTNPIADPSWTDAKYQESDNEEVFTAGEEMDEDIPTTNEEAQITEDQWEHHEEAAVSYANLRASIEGYYEENATTISQDQHLAAWAKSSNFMAWNLGPSVRQTTLAITEGPANAKGENVTQADTEEPPSHTEGEHVTIEDATEKDKFDKAEEEPTRAIPISNVRPITRPNPKVAMIESSSRPTLTDPPSMKSLFLKKLLQSLKEKEMDPDEPIRDPYIIIGKMHYLTNDEINAHLENKDKIKKAAKEAKMFKKTKTEVIKVVKEKDEKIGLDHKTSISAQAGEKFKKA